jgi:hypothetical protein
MPSDQDSENEVTELAHNGAPSFSHKGGGHYFVGLFLDLQTHQLWPASAKEAYIWRGEALLRRWSQRG